jgi:hypothetical protein
MGSLFVLPQSAEYSTGVEVKKGQMWDQYREELSQKANKTEQNKTQNEYHPMLNTWL